MRSAKRAGKKLPDLEVKKSKDVRGGSDWATIQSFKTWEASRKEFIYPENFLRPESR
jgi:hypothetical protein